MVDGNLCDAACYKYLAARPVPRRTEPHARYRAGPKTQSTKRNVVAGRVPGHDLRYFAHTLPQTQFQRPNSKDNEDSHLTFYTNFRHFPLSIADTHRRDECTEKRTPAICSSRALKIASFKNDPHANIKIAFMSFRPIFVGLPS